MITLKKYLLSTAFVLAAAATTLTAQTHQFGQLTQDIQESAEKWVVLCDKHLDLEQKVAYLNLLHLLLQSDDATIKCIQMLQENENTASVSEQFGMDMLGFIRSYASKKQKQFKKLNKQTEENVKRFEMTLEDMINTLSEHIFAHYYSALYKNVAATDESVLMCAFNKEGFIAPENRTQPLPTNII
jgi:hypothetical protein